MKKAASAALQCIRERLFIPVLPVSLSLLLHLLQGFILLLPSLAEPDLEAVLELLVTGVVALQIVSYLDFPEIDVDASEPSEEHGLERALLIVRIVERHADNAAEGIERSDGEREAPGLRREKVFVRRAALLPLLIGEPGAFREVDEGGRDALEGFADFPRGLDVPVPELRMPEEVCRLVAAHEWHAEPPAGDADEGDVEERVLEEELRDREVLSRDFADYEGVEPADVVRDDDLRC